MAYERLKVRLLITVENYSFVCVMAFLNSLNSSIKGRITIIEYLKKLRSKKSADSLQANRNYLKPVMITKLVCRAKKMQFFPYAMTRQ